MRTPRVVRPAATALALLLGLGVVVSAAGCGSGATGGPPDRPGATPTLVRVGRDSEGTTVSARVGDTIQIALGADLEWTLDPPAPAGILRPYDGPVSLIGGVQAHYTAAAPGTVTIVASGRPRCPAYAACVQVIIPFRTTVAVR